MRKKGSFHKRTLICSPSSSLEALECPLQTFNIDTSQFFFKSRKRTRKPKVTESLLTSLETLESPLKSTFEKSLSIPCNKKNILRRSENNERCDISKPKTDELFTFGSLVHDIVKTKTQGKTKKKPRLDSVLKVSRYDSRRLHSQNPLHLDSLKKSKREKKMEDSLDSLVVASAQLKPKDSDISTETLEKNPQNDRKRSLRSFRKNHMSNHSPGITHEQGRHKRIRIAKPEKIIEKMATVTFLDDSESKKDHKVQDNSQFKEGLRRRINKSTKKAKSVNKKDQNSRKTKKETTEFEASELDTTVKQSTASDISCINSSGEDISMSLTPDIVNINQAVSDTSNNKTASFLEYMNCNKIESKREKLEMILKENINKAEGLKNTDDTNDKLKRSSLMAKDAEIYTSDDLVPWHENKSLYSGALCESLAEKTNDFRNTNENKITVERKDEMYHSKNNEELNFELNDTDKKPITGIEIEMKHVNNSGNGIFSVTDVQRNFNHQFTCLSGMKGSTTVNLNLENNENLTVGNGTTDAVNSFEKFGGKAVVRENSNSLVAAVSTAISDSVSEKVALRHMHQHQNFLKPYCVEGNDPKYHRDASVLQELSCKNYEGLNTNMSETLSDFFIKSDASSPHEVEGQELLLMLRGMEHKSKVMDNLLHERNDILKRMKQLYDGIVACESKLENDGFEDKNKKVMTAALSATIGSRIEKEQTRKTAIQNDPLESSGLIENKSFKCDKRQNINIEEKNNYIRMNIEESYQDRCKRGDDYSECHQRRRVNASTTDSGKEFKKSEVSSERLPYSPPHNRYKLKPSPCDAISNSTLYSYDDTSSISELSDVSKRKMMHCGKSQYEAASGMDSSSCYESRSFEFHRSRSRSERKEMMRPRYSRKKLRDEQTSREKLERKTPLRTKLGSRRSKYYDRGRLRVHNDKTFEYCHYMCGKEKPVLGRQQENDDPFISNFPNVTRNGYERSNARAKRSGRNQIVSVPLMIKKESKCHLSRRKCKGTRRSVSTSILEGIGGESA